ncbi:MAG: NAD-binding protein [Gammaproteobacteria bacterium]|nr:NAD-binding protein [Gammaproteobacteria bacterium]MBU0785579.1 NAD-binding protein [Gammaproteobacteria bacterium]MBU0816867.1 NAD-binding protein [Gammaproteobacteria bacterium]MBU1787031.1 NAD-binding protein [Gammaproteobacteria bacterium]
MIIQRARHGIFILLRRLRMPLMVLIGVYAVAVLGFTLIDGIDPQGRPWRMSFLHAFYFVSFLGTTIGLGEIPYPFTDVQRLWATASIYGTVIAWLYAIGSLFNVLQDPMFRRILHENGVGRAVRRIDEPFYLICGYDDAGSHVTRELAEDGTRLVVIDESSVRIDSIEVEDLTIPVPALSGDASDPKTMVLAGLTSGHCAGVLALTGDDQINIKISLTAHLLNPDVPVLCGARNHESHARMAAAGVNHIINPYDTFAERVALSIRTPSLHVIYESLTTQRGTAMDEAPRIPRGRWILCGTGLFTRTLRRQLERLQIETVMVDPQLEENEIDASHIKGDPTDPDVLRAAGVDDATAVVAGTVVDIDNLAITMAARNLNKELFIVARQTQRRNTSVFRAAPADLIMLSGYVVAAEVLRVIRAPQLATFLRRARDEDEDWAAALLKRMRDVIGEDIVESWSVEITPQESPTVCAEFARGEQVSLRQLMTRPDSSGGLIRALPLLLQRGQERELRPHIDTLLQLGDRVLCCGQARARSTMRRNITAHELPETLMGPMQPVSLRRKAREQQAA